MARCGWVICDARRAAGRHRRSLPARPPAWPVPLQHDARWDELHYAETGPHGARVGWLRFDFHNGAMSTRQCERLRDALRWARTRDTHVLVLAGGSDFFSNGIHLHDIEASAHDTGDSAADASWRNINAIDDVVLELLTMTDRLSVAMLSGNAGAGGCYLAFAADLVGRMPVWCSTRTTRTWATCAARSTGPTLPRPRGAAAEVTQQ
jgi:putative two-component system hydrogenase maturation factor HypX/HoxX